MSMVWDGAKVVARVHAAGIKGLAQAAEMVLAKSKKATPVLTGALMRSGTTSPTNGGTLQVLSYDTPYALRQHEEHATKSKYLETPLAENRDAAQRYIAQAIARAMKG